MSKIETNSAICSDDLSPVAARTPLHFWQCSTHAAVFTKYCENRGWDATLGAVEEYCENLPLSEHSKPSVYNYLRGMVLEAS